MFETADQLTLAMSRGDEAAIEAFYRRYFDMMYRHASRVTRRDEAFCLDVVHDAVLRIVRTIKRMNDEKHLENWLKVVVRTSAFDKLRKEMREKKRERSRIESEHESSGPEELDWLRRSLLKLDPSVVRLIELRFVEGFTLGKLALMFQTTTGAIDGRLRRAIGKLREDWSDDEF